MTTQGKSQPGQSGSLTAGRLRNPMGFLLIPQFTVLSLASAIEPLRIANRYVNGAYDWRLISLAGGAVPDDNGIEIATHQSIRDVSDVGTLFICADQHPEHHVSDELIAWLRKLSAQGATLVSIDSAAFVLARAGLLEGHKVTMHWEVTSAFAERYPDIEVVNTLFEVEEGPISCAGGTAVLDLMLNLIEADQGSDVAQRVAEHCVREKFRRGGDSQRMRPPHERLAIAMQAGEAAGEGRVEVGQIAQMVGVSERQLLRLYRRYLGETPARFHLAQRLDRARALLRSTTMSVTEVCTACGFQSPAHFARTYRKAYGHSPSQERAHRASALMADRQSAADPAAENDDGKSQLIQHERQASRRRYS